MSELWSAGNFTIIYLFILLLFMDKFDIYLTFQQNKEIQLFSFELANLIIFLMLYLNINVVDQHCIAF